MLGDVVASNTEVLREIKIGSCLILRFDLAPAATVLDVPRQCEEPLGSLGVSPLQVLLC